ncbi:MAG: DUF4405 domain-containing protein [Verrucomicrobiota bacterium]
MRHVVNLGLLFVFVALGVTGLLAYLRPFSLTTTQVHLAAGLLTLILVFLHLASRVPYLQRQLTGRGKARAVIIAATTALLLLFAALALPPLSWIVDLSYESRHRAQIVRTSSLIGFDEPSKHTKLIVRQANDPASNRLSLLIRFRQDLDVIPSVAAWAETTAGTMIETLHLEPSLAYTDQPLWDTSITPRNHILPIWRHRFTLVSGIRPDGEVDALSGATETHSYALDPYLIPEEGNKFIISVELNASSDPNDAWSDPKVGQPSLLYTALVKVDEEQPYTILELTGHGGNAEDSGNIQYDLDSFTSAKELIDLLLVKVERR